MFCPNCGAPEQRADTYCKKCGTYLRDASFRGWLLGRNNPGNAAWSIVASCVFIALICVCIIILIVRAESDGKLVYLKYAVLLCWVIIGYLVTLSLVGFRLWRKIRRVQSSFDESAQANNSGGIAPSLGRHTGRLRGAQSSGEAPTELLSSPAREFKEGDREH